MQLQHTMRCSRYRKRQRVPAGSLQRTSTAFSSKPTHRTFAAKLLTFPYQRKASGMASSISTGLCLSAQIQLPSIGWFSNGDFGLAYLTERWASRFVGELFRDYVVCFVGYSVEDPVMRYMVDALSADRLWGEVRHKVYAFAPHGRGKRAADKAREVWAEKRASIRSYMSRGRVTTLSCTAHCSAGRRFTGMDSRASVPSSLGRPGSKTVARNWRRSS